MNEKQLIFLISQPRSGSTLLQRLLGAHSSVYTRSEPWLMLNPAYTLKSSGIEAEYDFKLSNNALIDFCKHLPDGKKTYISELRKMYLNLYSQYIKDTKYQYFLDKTPRYYFIINELLQIFPESKYILLIRNPLAVLGSIINSWTKDNWNELYKFKYDLFDAIDVYINIINKNNKNILIINYEDLLNDEDKILRYIFHYLNLDNEKVSEKYYKNSQKWLYGDQISVYKEKGIKKDNNVKWQKGLKDIQYWRVMHDYLYYIGKEKLEKIGYDFDEQDKILNDSLEQNNFDRIKNKTIPLIKLLNNSDDIVIDNQKKQNEIKNLNNQLQTTKQQLQATKQQFQTTQQQLQEEKRKMIAKQKQLNVAYGSREYRVGLKFQKIFKIFFPMNSLRREFLIKCVNRVKKNNRLLKKIKTFLYIFLRSNYYRFRFEKNRSINLKAKKIVYVGHSYHNKTKSTVFLQEYLDKFFDVEVISDDSWNGKKYPDLSFINKKEYIGVVFFQLLPPKDVLEKIDNDNIIFCPMYDQSGCLDFNYWDQYRGLKILNFSKTLHKKLKKWGFESMYIQYFPKVKEFFSGKLNEIFFWQRLEKINIKTVINLLKNKDNKIHIHKAMDPNHKFVEPTKKEKIKYNITYSKWFDTREEMQELIKSKGIYIAPREYEGIGQSFLEAMSMGKAVIAVNNPTMNEYIKDGETGYLVDLENLQEIDLKNVAQVQKNTYNYMKDGRKQWEKNKKNIINFVKNN